MDEKTIYSELKSINAQLTRLDEKLTGYKEYQDKTNEALEISKKNEEDIKELQDKNKYLSRTITTAIITGLIGIVFLFIKIGMGVK